MANFLQELRAGLFNAFVDDVRVVLLGEDVLDPYGGAFKVTQGLSTQFPERVIRTPISEAGITGAAAGMAIRGLRPIVEIMFGDFLTLCTDQIVNHITKFSTMYPGVHVPLVIRTPMGGGRGYGATHSQSLEKMYLGVPGLTVVAPSLAHNPGRLIQAAIVDDAPVLFIENKQLYSQSLCDAADPQLDVRERAGCGHYPVAVVQPKGTTVPDVTILSYGGASRHVLAVMRRLSEEEIVIKALFPASIKPIPIDGLLEEINPAGPILIVEEGSSGFNWGSELAAVIYERLLPVLKAPIKRLAAQEALIPCAAYLEQKVLVNEEQIESAIMEALSCQ